MMESHPPELSMDAPVTRKLASPAQIEALRDAIARADEALQIEIASVRRQPVSDDRTMAVDALEKARAALSCWLPPHS
jgi:non-canonical (house-cleaning) NTP pyrophosphatase